MPGEHPTHEAWQNYLEEWPEDSTRAGGTFVVEISGENVVVSPGKGVYE